MPMFSTQFSQKFPFWFALSHQNIYLWGAAPKSTVNLLDPVQKGTIFLIDKPELTDSLPPRTGA